VSAAAADPRRQVALPSRCLLNQNWPYAALPPPPYCPPSAWPPGATGAGSARYEFKCRYALAACSCSFC
jgi:hypothetical protein